MKKFLLLISLVFLVGCSASPSVEEAPSSDSTDLAALLSEKAAANAVLEYQVEALTEQLTNLQMENDTLLAASEGLSGGDQPSSFMCEQGPATVRYDSRVGTVAIVEGWFASQPFVQKVEGTFSVPFWSDVKSTIHTIRYISADDGISTTANFLIMFEEAGWQPGVLWMTESCWLDYPY